MSVSSILLLHHHRKHVVEDMGPECGGVCWSGPRRYLVNFLWEPSGSPEILGDFSIWEGCSGDESDIVSSSVPEDRGREAAGRPAGPPVSHVRAHALLRLKRVSVYNSVYTV